MLGILEDSPAVDKIFGNFWQTGSGLWNLWIGGDMGLTAVSFGHGFFPAKPAIMAISYKKRMMNRWIKPRIA